MALTAWTGRIFFPRLFIFFFSSFISNGRGHLPIWVSFFFLVLQNEVWFKTMYFLTRFWKSTCIYTVYEHHCNFLATQPRIDVYKCVFARLHWSICNVCFFLQSPKIVFVVNVYIIYVYARMREFTHSFKYYMYQIKTHAYLYYVLKHRFAVIKRFF